MVPALVVCVYSPMAQSSDLSQIAASDIWYFNLPWSEARERLGLLSSARHYVITRSRHSDNGMIDTMRTHVFRQ